MLSKLMVELCRLSYREDFENCLLKKNIQLQNICTKYNIEINDIICIKNVHTCVNIIKSRRFCIVVFKGTNDIYDLMTDINFFPKKTQVGVVHRGFYNTFLKVYPDIKEHLEGAKNKIFLTGHSLGAALAILCSAYFKHLNPILVTFGSPRVGAKSFTDYVSKDIMHIRWQNVNDVVCYSPPIFKHFGEKRSILFGTFFNKNHGSKYYKNIIFNKYLNYYDNEIL
jgi:hypothetical protein